MQTVRGKQYFKVREFVNIREMFRQSLELYTNVKSFVFRESPQSDPKSKTYLQFSEDFEQFGAAMLANGLQHKKIAIIGENSYEWRVAHFAIICGLGVSVPLDRLLPEDEILNLLGRGEVSAVVYDPMFHETMLKAFNLFPAIKLFICMNTFKLKEHTVEFEHSIVKTNLPEQRIFIKIDDLMSQGRNLIEGGNKDYFNSEIDPDAMMSLLFTSGTTSKSKAVMLSHKNVCADIKALAGVVYFDPGTRALSVLPLHHTFENTCGFIAGFYFGFTIYENDGRRYIQKNMEEYKITCLIGVPLLFESFYTKITETVKKQGKETTLHKGIKISNVLRKLGIDIRKKLFKDILIKFGGEFKTGICGAAPIDPEIIIFFEAIGVRILQGYGLTETSPVVAGCNSKVFVPGSVGNPLTGVEIAIDNDLPGTVGDILVRGDMVMIGYYKDADATREAIDENGWFHTGDIGRIDPKNNCLYITGRKKSMIVLKNGKKVFPEEIEFLLGQVDFIKESLVWGEAEEDGDVDVWVKVVLDKDILHSQGGDVNDEKSMKSKLDAAIKAVNKTMPSFKSIKYFIFGQEDMEKTTTKKIKRGVELQSVREILDRNRIKIKEIAGKNFDVIRNLVLHNKTAKEPHEVDSTISEHKDDGETK